MMPAALDVLLTAFRRLDLKPREIAMIRDAYQEWFFERGGRLNLPPHRVALARRLISRGYLSEGEDLQGYTHGTGLAVLILQWNVTRLLDDANAIVGA
jgi:hypothetical protein